MWFSTFGVQGFVLQSRTDGVATISYREFETITKLVSILEKTDVGFSGPNQPKLIDDENLCYTYTLRVYCRGFLWERERLPCLVWSGLVLPLMKEKELGIWATPVFDELPQRYVVWKITLTKSTKHILLVGLYVSNRFVYLTWLFFFRILIGCSFSGEIPAEIGKLSNLISL